MYQIAIHLSRVRLDNMSKHPSPSADTQDMHIEEGTYVEIIGSVKEDLTVRALTSFNLGSNLDMKAVNAVVEFGHSSKGEGVLRG